MAIMLTKNFQLISTIPLTYGEIRTYAKYSTQSIESSATSIQAKEVYYVSAGSVSFDSSSAKLQVGSSTPVSVSGGYGTVYNGETTIISMGGTLYHNENGVCPETDIKTWWTASYGGSGSTSVKVVAPNISRYPMITSATNFNDTENPTITYSTIMGFENATLYGCISTDGTTDTVSYRQLTVADGQYTFNLTTAERNALRNATPNSNILTVTFILKTTVGTTNYYSKLEKNMTIVNADPTYTHSEIETNANVISVLGTNNANTIIENASQVQITINPTAYKGASVSSVRLTHSGSEPETKTSSPYVFTKNVKGNSFGVVVTDSRSNSYAGLITKTLINYIPVKINSVSFVRQNPTSSNIIVNLQADYKQTTFGSTANVPTIKWKLDDGSYTTIPSSNYVINATNNTISLVNYTLSNALVYTSSGNFSIEVSDLLSASTENDILVIKGIPTFDYGEHDLNVNGDLYVSDTSGNNKVNVLTKINNNETNITNARTYSTTEKVVGDWLGKPLYRKVINVGTLPNNTTKTTAHNISNLKRVINVYGYAYRSSDGLTIGLPYVGGQLAQMITCQINSTNLLVITLSDRRAFTDSYVIIEYTKTTD